MEISQTIMTLFAVIIGFALDAVFGDPEGMWHPVCSIGSLIKKTENMLRKPEKNAKIQKIAGVFLWVIVCLISFLIPWLFLWVMGRVSIWLRFAAETLFCYQIFARKSLADAGKYVRREIKKSLDDGRKAIARYVGRDTNSLDEDGVIRAAVETISENTTDGVISPLVFMLIGGAPLGFFYKAVNTLDSMVGYKNDKYEHFGWFSAKMDDIFNFIPARIAAVLMMAASGMLKFDAKHARMIFIRDRFKSKSPNSAQTESVCAGALHIQLGGGASYFGKYINKPTIGDDNRKIVSMDIERAIDLMTTTSVFALLLGVAIRLALM